MTCEEILPQKSTKSTKRSNEGSFCALCAFCAFLWLLLFSWQAQDGELNCSPAEAHCFARARSPDVDTTTTHHAARVGHQILTTVRTRIKPHACAQRQVPRIRSNQSLGYWFSARRSSAQTVRGGDVCSRRCNVSFFGSDLFADGSLCRRNFDLLLSLRRQSFRRESSGRKDQRAT